METAQNNIPTLRFPEFEGEWKNIIIDDIAIKVNSGKTPLGGESVYTETGVLFIRSQNVVDDRLSLETTTYIPEEINSTMKSSVVLPNDILLNITGASLGRSCVVPKDFSYGNVNQHVCIIRLKNNHEPSFIQPIFSSDKGQNIFISLQTGSGREGLNFQSIRKIKLMLPSLPEQQKIASFLCSIDNKIQQLKRKKELLELYKKGVMQQIFSQRLRFKDDNGKDYPDWEEKRLGEFVLIKSGDSPSKHQLKIKGAYPYLKVEDLNNSDKYQSLSREYSNSETNVIKEMAVIFPKRGAAIMTNKVRINTVPVHLDTNLMAILPNQKALDTEFLYYKITFDKLYKIADTSSIPQINNKHILPYLIMLPSLNEQQKMANFLSSIDQKIRLVQAEIEQTQQFKKGLLQQMFV